MANIKDPKKVSELPDEFKNLDNDKILKRASEIEAEIAKVMETISSQQADLGSLKRYIAENELGCRHETLVRKEKDSYTCKECKLRIAVKSPL